jgi:regulator of RNase E activity RraA
LVADVSAVHRGLAGFISDGAVRDAGEIREEGLPTFARLARWQ